MTQDEIRAALAPTEHELQCALIRWCDLQGPPFDLIYAIPNGGHRNKATAGRLKASGVRAGVPDLVLPVPNRYSGALYLELKTEKGRLRKEQAAMMERLREAGNAVFVVRTLDEAIDLLQTYLSHV